MPASNRPAIGRHGPDQQHGRHHVVHLAGELAGVEGQAGRAWRRPRRYGCCRNAESRSTPCPPPRPDAPEWPPRGVATARASACRDGARAGDAVDGDHRLVGEVGELLEQRDSPDLGVARVACPAWPSRYSNRSGGLVITLAIRNTSSATPVNVRPLAERFGSSSGRRTITGSSSSRIRKNAADGEQPDVAGLDQLIDSHWAGSGVMPRPHQSGHCPTARDSSRKPGEKAIRATRSKFRTLQKRWNLK